MRSVIVLLLLGLISGCATKQWVPAQGKSLAEFEPDKAKCSLMARHSGSGFAAAGSPNYVAGATLGYAVGEAVRTKADFDDCMTVSGWRAQTLPPAAVNSTAATPAATDQKVAQIKSSRERRSRCIEAVRNRPQFEVLRPHMSDFKTGEYTLSQLVDDRRPTQTEISVLVAYWDEIRLCNATYRREIATLSPKIADAYGDLLIGTDAAVISVSKGRETWGEFLQRQKAVNEAFREKVRTDRT